MARKFRILTAAAGLLSALLACNMPAPATGTQGDPGVGTQVVAPDITATTAVTAGTGTETTSEPLPIDSAGTVFPTVPPEGGFRTGTVVDASTLPTLAVPATGAAGGCHDPRTDMAITLEHIVAQTYVLCLYNWPITTGGPSLRVTLTDPSGGGQSADFSFGAIDTGLMVANAAGQEAGFVIHDSEFFAGVEAVALNLHFEAPFAEGEWTATAEALDGSTTVGPVPITLEHDNPIISVMYALDAGMLDQQPGDYTTGDVLYIMGAGYEPNTTLTVVLFLKDTVNVDETGQPTLVPKYAVSVTSDATGFWRAEFVVGAGTPHGDYQTYASYPIEPDALPNPFTGTFSIH